MRYCACICFERSVFPFPPRPCSCREMEAKRLRKSNFSEMEIKILLHEISMESELLSSCFSNKVTLQKKQEIWKNIAAKVSACGVAVRTVAEIKDKWGLLKRTTLQKKRDAYKTGGGKGMPPPEYEDTVVAILGNNTSLINGIAGNATDSFVAGLEETQPSVSKSEGVTEEITQSVRPLTTESAPCLNNSLTCNKENEFSSPSTSLADLYPSTPLSMDNRETFGIKKKKRVSKGDEEQQLTKKYLKERTAESLLRQQKIGLQIKKLELEVWLLEAEKRKIEKEMNDN